jgi:hypothetical protein
MLIFAYRLLPAAYLLTAGRLAVLHYLRLSLVFPLALLRWHQLLFLTFPYILVCIIVLGHLACSSGIQPKGSCQEGSGRQIHGELYSSDCLALKKKKKKNQL